MKKHNKFRSKHDKYSFKCYELRNKDKNKRLRITESYTGKTK